MPDYRSIDEDPRWHQWLLGTDMLSGRMRQVLLDDAVASGDATRIANFFRKFLNEAAPAQASSAYRAGSMPSGKIYTRAEITRLYEQHRRGAYRGREAAWQAQEADIIAAAREGRVLGDYVTK